MSMPVFGTPTPANSPTPTNPDDAFAGAGLPSADEPGGDALGPVIGVFDAVCKGLKTIPPSASGWSGYALEFELTGGDVAGEQYSMMAPAFDANASGKDRKMAVRKWTNIGDACQAMGLAVDPQTKRPLEGFEATAGLTCRLAVSTYRNKKTGLDTPTIVLGRPSSRMSNGVEVGFPESEKGADGRFRNYGCGVLPPE